MKKLALLAIWLALPLAGCKTVSTPPPAWAPNSQVAVAGYAIASGNAAVVQFEADVKGGFVPAPALRTVMSDMQQALAIAQPIFVQWEQAARTNAATPEPAGLPASIQKITTDLAKLPTVATGSAQ
jgi:hypothetical protein